jgi:hypothetical protein
VRVSEAIEKLQIILKEQGDCDIVIDSDGATNYIEDFDFVNKWYIFNRFIDNIPENRAFILYKDKEWNHGVIEYR